LTTERAKRLRRKTRAAALISAQEVERQQPDRPPFQRALRPNGTNAEAADRLTRLDAVLAAGCKLPANVTFPGSGFGVMCNPRPLTVAALSALWRHGPPFAVTCPGCAGSARILCFGGGFTIGSGEFVCSTCASVWLQTDSGAGWSLALPRLEVSMHSHDVQPTDAFEHWLSDQERSLPWQAC
jgi:hypothetical protein